MRRGDAPRSDVLAVSGSAVRIEWCVGHQRTIALGCPLLASISMHTPAARTVLPYESSSSRTLRQDCAPARICGSGARVVSAGPVRSRLGALGSSPRRDRALRVVQSRLPPCPIVRANGWRGSGYLRGRRATVVFLGVSWLQNMASAIGETAEPSASPCYAQLVPSGIPAGVDGVICRHIAISEASVAARIRSQAVLAGGCASADETWPVMFRRLLVRWPPCVSSHLLGRRADLRHLQDGRAELSGM